jgi:lipopolysaccharide export system protein LptC
MKDRFPTIASTLILIALVIGTWVAADYTQRAVKLEATAKKTHEPDSWARDIIIVRTNEQGIAISRLEGDYMEHFPDDESYEITVPRAYNLPADSPMTLATSRMATLYEQGERIVMNGDAVLIRIGDAERAPLNITSQQIILLSADDVAYTDLPAVAVNGRSRLSGVGMRYDNKTRELQVFESTDVEIAPRQPQEANP